MTVDGGLWRARLAWREIFWATLLFTGVMVLLAYPISVHPAALRFPTGPDGDLGIYLLGWNTHAFLHRPWAIFDANIYYPARLTLAFGENIIGIALFAAPVIWVTGDLQLAANFACLLSAVLCGLGAYVLARRVGLGVAAAVVCGLIFEASPPRFFRTAQINLATIYWIPFGLAALHAYFDEGRRRDLRLAVACFTLQVLASGHGAVFMAVAVGGFLIYRFALGDPLAPLKRVRDLGVTGLLLLLPSILVFLPYRLVQREAGLRRGLGSWGVAPGSWLASPSHVHRYVLHALGIDRWMGPADAYLFPGYLPILLALVVTAWPAWVVLRAIVRRVRSTRTVNSNPQGAVIAAGGARGGVTTTPVARAVSAWGRAAVVLEVAAAAALPFALLLSATGPFKWRVGRTVLFSTSGPLRAWLVFAGLVAARLAIARLAPLDLHRRVAAAWAAVKSLARRVGETGRRVPALEWVEPLRARAARYRRNPAGCYAFLTLLGLALSAGPPYGPWRYLYSLPVFSFIRANHRFTLLAMLGLSVMAGVGFEWLTARMRPGRRLAAGALVGIALVAELAAMPMRSQPTTVSIPAIDRWLDTQPKPFVVAEVPVPEPEPREPFEQRQTAFMIHSTAHWQKTVHGFSGWRLGEHEALFQHLIDFPTPATIDELATFDVTYVVVHTDYYRAGEWPPVEERLRQSYPRLRLEHVEGAGRVYSLHR